MEKILSFGKLETSQVDDITTLAESQKLGWQIKAYNFPEIWVQTKGKGVKVAVIDTAVDIKHPDLNVIGGYDFVNNCTLSSTTPKIGHGTHVCGIIGAIDNGKGILGVAPECSIYSCVVLGENGSGGYDGIINALDWCIENKIDVINMSLGGTVDTPEFYAAIRRVYDAKIPIICAAGNSAWETGYLDFPGTYNETIAIASIKQDLTRSEFSSIGSNIDVCAPGSEILSCIPEAKYAIYSGTSMATPFVTGLVALLIAKHRTLGGDTPINNVEDVREHLIKVAKDVDYAGQDSFSGYGLVNPVDSINYEKSTDNKIEKPIEKIPPLVETPKDEKTFTLGQIIGLFFDWFCKLFK